MLAEVDWIFAVFHQAPLADSDLMFVIMSNFTASDVHSDGFSQLFKLALKTRLKRMSGKSFFFTLCCH